MSYAALRATTKCSVQLKTFLGHSLYSELYSVVLQRMPHTDSESYIEKVENI